jgi:hypothetical protein
VAVPDEAGCLIYSLSERIDQASQPNIDNRALEAIAAARYAESQRS